jgi:L-cysteine/cystine lyase
MNHLLHRQQFPALANKVYFNYGGQGPMAQVALTAIADAQSYMQEIGPFGNQAYSWFVQELKEARQAIASELQVNSEAITLTEDVTVGCNIAMWGIDWRQGDRLLLSDCEHPGIVAIAQEIGRRFGVEIDTCPLMATLNEGNPVEVIAQHLHSNTRLLVLSHVLWNTGQVLPLAEIVKTCADRPYPVRILVDAAQSVGCLPLNLTELGVDFYAFTGHKWLCGPAGVGGLYVKPEARESLKPTFIGWRSVTYNSQGQPGDWQPDGRRYEIATSDYPLYAGLRAAIAYSQQWGSATERYQQIFGKTKYLWEQLSTLPNVKLLRTSPPESGLVSFQVKSSQPLASQQLVEFLEAQGIFTRTIIDPDCVRACVHYLTSDTEIERLVGAIGEFTHAKTQRR